MSRTYYRPLVQHGPARPDGALILAGGPLWFTHAEAMTRDRAEVVHASDLPVDWAHRLSAPRTAIAGLDLTRPRIMGILNVTPDSFSDGGRFHDPAAAIGQGRTMAAACADILDVGGESTRPGATEVDAEEEIARTVPVLSDLAQTTDAVLSIDTRKAAVAEATLKAGAALVNDVSGFTFDPALAPLCAARGAPICVMHSQGNPETMQDDPSYDNVLLDVFDTLSSRLADLESLGFPRKAMLVDPGIGFGKTGNHNLTILKNIALFHGLGCGILIGASRKGFIGAIGGASRTEDRMPGSLAVALAALAQGVQILRVHDVAETAQAVRLWQAVR